MTVFRVKSHSGEKTHEVVVLGLLIGLTSPIGLMNIHAVPSGEVRAFVNALFESTTGEYCVLS